MKTSLRIRRPLEQLQEDWAEYVFYNGFAGRDIAESNHPIFCWEGVTYDWILRTANWHLSAGLVSKG